MERNNGMRPQDIALLLKLLLWEGKKWMKKDLASELFISPAEVGHSLKRSSMAGLVTPDERKIMKKAFRDFLIYGFSFVFPVKPGSITKGMPTAHSAPVLNKLIVSGEAVVWPYPEGKMKGQAIIPLYQGAIKASIHDEKFYELLCLCDTLRIGKLREREIAKEILMKRI